VLPDEATNSWVFVNSLVFAIAVNVVQLGTFDRDIIDVWDCDVQNLILQNEHNIFVKYGHRVHPPHW
jgi:hypothetical protein